MVNMTYIEIKTVYGRQYKYLRKAIRVGKKVQHINLKYLGPVNPVYKIEQKRKSNASIYIRRLKETESKELTIATKSTNAFKRDRAKILLFSSQKYIPREIAERISCDVRKVRKTIKAFNRIGLKALERGKANGAKSKFTKEQRAKMLEIASTDPVKMGLHFTTWSLRKLKRCFEDRKIVKSISINTIRSVFKGEGMNWKKSKRFQYSNDPEFAKKNF
jgi:transposase